jgi:hypothetical protein
MSYSRWSGLFLMLLVLAACAVMKNTPAQERVENDFAACKSETHDDVTLERVTPDGSFSYRLATNQIEARRFQACMESRGYRFAK